MATGQPRNSSESTAWNEVAPNRELRKSDEAAPSSQTSAFQAAIGAWRNIDLTNLQKSLDTTAGDIVNGQRESLVERKELAQKTKEYRKLDDEQKKEEWKGLLKSYQIFIDHLTTSKKTTETSFLSLYSTLSEAPDPYPLLDATIDSLVNFSDMQEQSKENDSLKAMVNRLSIQISNLETSLNSKNKEIERKEKEKEEEAAKAEEVWRGVLDEKSRNWEGKEKALLEKLEHQEVVLKEIRASYEVVQRMGPTSAAAEEDLLGKERSAELEILTRDLERTTLRLAEVEGRNEQLRLELEKASSYDTTGQALSQGNDAEEEDKESTILRLQHENANLLRKFNNAKAEVETTVKECERKTRSLERMVDGLENDKAVLKGKVCKWSDYEDVRRELEILKSIEFSTGDEDEDVLELAAISAQETDEKKESLEQLLLARNKKLGNELTVLRVSHQDLTTRLQTLQLTLDSTTSGLSSARALNQKLEDDLYKFQHETQQHHSSTLSVAGTYVSRYPQSAISKTRISPASSIIGTSHSPLEGAARNAANELAPGSAGILPMITAQRDRFKQKNQQLEDELSRAQTTISSLRGEVSSLQKDNMSLYEKTRYVSSYLNPVGVSPLPSSSAAAAKVSSSASSSFNAVSGVSIDRYRQAYEANISPFEAFRGRESARAYHRMGLAERLLYSLTRVVLANRVSRNLFAAYCVLLHVLVFFMLYWAGTAEVGRHVGGIAAGGQHLLKGAAGGAAGVGVDAGGGAGEHGGGQPIGFDDRI